MRWGTADVGFGPRPSSVIRSAVTLLSRCRRTRSSLAGRTIFRRCRRFRFSRRKAEPRCRRGVLPPVVTAVCYRRFCSRVVYRRCVAVVAVYRRRVGAPSLSLLTCGARLQARGFWALRPIQWPCGRRAPRLSSTARNACDEFGPPGPWWSRAAVRLRELLVSNARLRSTSRSPAARPQRAAHRCTSGRVASSPCRPAGLSHCAEPHRDCRLPVSLGTGRWPLNSSEPVRCAVSGAEEPSQSRGGQRRLGSWTDRDRHAVQSATRWSRSGRGSRVHEVGSWVLLVARTPALASLTCLSSSSRLRSTSRALLRTAADVRDHVHRCGVRPPP